MAAGGNSKYSEILERNTFDIVKELQNVDDVLQITDNLVSDGTLHLEAKQEIQAKKTRGQTILVLIKHLKQRITTTGFGSFLQCLRVAGYGDLAKHIRIS